MKINKLLFIFVLLLFVAPVFVRAECSQTGSTIIFINGIWTDEEDAERDSERLRTEYRKSGQYRDVGFLTGYNDSHIGGLGDLAKTVVQMYSGGKMDFDMTNILLKLYNELKTQKVLLLGHSQGTFYSNIAYDYLTKNGVGQNSIGVYNVATPADTVAGDGKYLTSSNDRVIEEIARQLAGALHASEPLPPNITLPLSKEAENDEYGGHGFREDYLAYAADRIISEIDQGLSKLTASGSKDECFAKPKTGLVYTLKSAGFAFTDTIAENPEMLATSPTAEQLASIRNSLFSGIQNLGQKIASGVVELGKNISGLGDKIYSAFAQKFNGNNLWEASLTSASPSASNQNNVLNITGGASTDQPALPEPSASPAVALPKNESRTEQSKVGTDGSDTTKYIGVGGENIAPTTEQELQDLLDNIKEKLDIITQQVNNMLLENSQTQPANSNQNPNLNNQNVDNQSIAGATFYPKILINEIQIAGSANEKNEFVELYNPDTSAVSLSNWYLQRRTGTGQGYDTFVGKNALNGKTILAKGYFLIARQGSSFESIADYVVGQPLTENNALILINPNDEMSDKVGWGQAQDYETSPVTNPASDQSIARIWGSASQTSQDTDNNSIDFGSGNPTPKANNATGGGSPNGCNCGGGTASYSKILISEIKVSPTAQRFVKLYNPNSTNVSLTGWYLQRKDANDTSWSSFVSSTNFNGKTISAGGYLLISRELGGSDILLDITLSNDNSLALKNPNGEISDKVGFGSAQEYETSPTVNPPSDRSISRKTSDSTKQDTDNNLNDFELSSAPEQGDTAVPVITLNGSAEITIYAGETYTDAGATALDNTDGDISANIVVVNPVDVNVAGDYTVTYNVSDAAGNRANQVTRLVHVIAIPKILISEVQVAGQTTEDEFVELYNPNNFNVDLTDFALKKKTSGGTEKNLVSSGSFTGTILAGGYFLIAPRDNDDGSKNYTGTITPDLRYSGKVTSDFKIASDNTVLLYNNYGTLLDKVGFGSAQDYETATFATSPSASKSIQRIWDYISSQPQDTNDNSADFYIFNATTPKSSSPQFCTFDNYNGFTFSQNTTLKKSCTYVFRGTEVVASGVTLTINPGAVIKFIGSGLQVEGVLKAIGSASQPIIFTSLYDNDYGGTYDPDQVVSAGQWSGILFSQSSVGSELENIILRYSGSQAQGLSFGAGIGVDQTDITLKNSIIEKNLNYGLRLTFSSSIVDSVQFYDNQMRSDSPSEGVAIMVEGGSPQITNGTFKGNYTSIYLAGMGPDGYPVVQGNSFKDNTYPICLDGTNFFPNFSGNTATGNDYNAIVLTEQVERDITFYADLPYFIRGTFYVPPDVTLTINPGAVIKFLGASYGSQITADGTIKAIGSASQPIVFTSLYDNDYGGLSRSGGTPLAGQWPGVLINSTSVGSELENVIVRYAGGNLGGYVGAGIKVVGTGISIKNSIFQNNLVSGLSLINVPAGSIVDNVQVLTNQGAGSVKGFYISGGSLEIKNSHFGENNYGIYMDSFGAILPSVNLHPDPDPEKNTFENNTVADIFYNYEQ